MRSLIKMHFTEYLFFYFKNVYYKASDVYVVYVYEHCADTLPNKINT